MTFKLENLKKPSNKQFKLIADILLFTLPLYLSAIMLAPMPEDIKLWINFGLSIVIITIKALTKFTTDSVEV